MKYLATREADINGEKRLIQGIYVVLVRGGQRRVHRRGTGSACGGMARDLFHTGVLQRWASVSCLSACLPGQEDATFERMKKFIAASGA